jgi:hypothetical protein
VLPDPDDTPSTSRQRFLNGTITGQISFKFVEPKLAVRVRDGAVNWASVPEAPIYENGEPCVIENEIWTAENLGSATPPGNFLLSENRDDAQFRCPIATASHAAHYLGSFRRGKNVCHNRVSSNA